MVIDKHTLLVIEKLQLTENNNQVEGVISAAISNLEKTANIEAARLFILQLSGWLKDLSPLDWNSTQWSCLRYASIYLSIYLREYSMTALV
ncbi:hypothetical protein [Chitinophaga sp. MM2321]|uniref:hypothetical protein n=1 Tax=Chitinophaga sp. MM2321 TaxID=3137178 RepID=UPI0032D58765